MKRGGKRLSGIGVLGLFTVLAACSGCSLLVSRTGKPPEMQDLSSPEMAWNTFRSAASDKQYWRAYCCLSDATKERISYFDFSYEGKKPKWRKAFGELEIIGDRRLSPTRMEFVTNYKEPFDRFEIVFEDGRWKVHVPDKVFEED